MTFERVRNSFRFPCFGNVGISLIMPRGKRNSCICRLPLNKMESELFVLPQKEVVCILFRYLCVSSFSSLLERRKFCGGGIGSGMAGVMGVGRASWKYHKLQLYNRNYEVVFCSRIIRFAWLFPSAFPLSHVQNQKGKRKQSVSFPGPNTLQVPQTPLS